MSVYVYAGDRYYQLPGNKIVQSGTYITFKNTDSLVINGFRYTLGIVPNQVIIYRTVYLTSGDSMTDVQLGQQASVYISSGAVAANVEIASGGRLQIAQSGGYADTITIDVGGRFIIDSAATANVPSVRLNGGYLYHHYDYSRYTVIPNTFSNAVLNSGDTCTLQGQTTARGIVVSSMGYVQVNKRGVTATDIQIKQGGVVSVAYSAVSGTSGLQKAYVSNIQVSSGGLLYVPGYAGNNVTQVLLYSGASVRCSDWTSVTTSMNRSYCALAYNPWVSSLTGASNGGVSVYFPTGHTNNTYDGIVTGVPSACVYYGSGGLISKTAVLSGVNMTGQYRAYVQSGATANSTTVSSGGSMIVSSGVTVNATTINAYGILYVSSGVTLDQLTLSAGGNFTAVTGVIVNSVTVNSGCTFTVSSGGTAADVVVSDGGKCIIFAVAPDTYVQGTSAGSTFLLQSSLISGYKCQNHGLTIYGGATAISTIASYTTGSNGTLNVSNGGTALSTTISSGGTMYVSSGGTAVETTLDGGWLQGSGFMSQVTVNSGGTLFVPANRVASSVVVNFSGYARANDSGTIDGITLNQGGVVQVYTGGHVFNITENGGYVSLVSASLIQNLTFVPNTFSGLVFPPTTGETGGRHATVHSGTTANAITLNLSGFLDVYTGGITNSATVNSGGSITVSSGGTANSTTLNAQGKLYVNSGGTALSTTISSGGSLAVYAGGTALNVVSNTGAQIFSSAGAVITYA